MSLMEAELPQVFEATPPPFVPGCFPDMPAEIYHDIEALSQSGGHTLRKQSAAHYKEHRDSRKTRKVTAAMQFGTAVHTGVLEPHKFKDYVLQLPEINRRSKAGQEEYAAFITAAAGKVVLTFEDYSRALACINAVQRHRGAQYLLRDGRNEISLFWQDKDYGVPCKCRLDCTNRGGIVDLKTSSDASAEEFGRSAANFDYHAQGAHYLSGAEQTLHEVPKFFVFIVVESEPPFAIALYVMREADILAGRHLMRIALERYRTALQTGIWASYPEDIQPLKLPRYALRFDD